MVPLAEGTVNRVLTRSKKREPCNRSNDDDETSKKARDCPRVMMMMVRLQKLQKRHRQGDSCNRCRSEINGDGETGSWQEADQRRTWLKPEINGAPYSGAAG